MRIAHYSRTEERGSYRRAETGVKRFGGEGKEMVPETPPPVKTCWTGTQVKSILFCLMSPHLITAQLICPGAICCRDAGALMWRCVDFELERSAGVWSEWLGVFSTEQFPNRR